MMRCRAIPLTVDLFDSPELAVLAVLDTAVEVALAALVVAYPDNELDADELPIERRAARGLVTAAHDLSEALARYRLALARAKERDRIDNNPF
jgi:hypothetical protein